MVHRIIEKQKRDTGSVRVIIIKGRQQGISTYVQARFFWRLIHSAEKEALKAYILTHLSDSTQSIFGMTKMFLEQLPYYKPILGKCSINELYFSEVNSGYRVGTAGSQGLGRGNTVHLFHGSEVSRWPNPEEHFDGIMQSVPHRGGSEIILESTANGIGNFFHRKCMDALAKNSRFKLIFIPWTLQKEYTLEADEGDKYLDLNEEELDLKKRYDLSDGQLRWRRDKMRELSDPRKFLEEYPLNPHEAFIGDTDRTFITRREVDCASNPEEDISTSNNDPIIMGVDPARLGEDFTGIAVRCGRILTHIDILEKMDSMQLCGRIIVLINQFKPDRVFIDMGSFGAAIYDRLCEKGYTIIRGINFGQAPDDTTRYGNKRAEMYDRMKRWLNKIPCKIPNDEVLKCELTSIGYFENSSGKLMLEKKSDMRRRGVPSPDKADAFCLTFAENVTHNSICNIDPYIYTPDTSWNPYLL